MTPIAASVTGLVVWIIIAAIVGIGKLMEQAAANAKRPLNPPPAPRGRGSIREKQAAQSPESEEERTRKFLEALGLPSTTLQPKPAPTVLRPPSAEVMRRPASAPLQPPPMPSLSRTQVEASRLERKRRAAEERRTAQKAQEALEEAPYDGAIERVRLPELKTQAMPEFQTRSSDVSAIPFEAKNSVAGQVYIKEESARMSETLKLARSPKALRQAILLREILGPPRSLQSYGVSSSFGSL